MIACGGPSTRGGGDSSLLLDKWETLRGDLISRTK